MQINKKEKNYESKSNNNTNILKVILSNPYLISSKLLCGKLDARGSVHRSIIHKEKSNKMQQCINILLFHIYKKLNMFRVTHRPSSGA